MSLEQVSSEGDITIRMDKETHDSEPKWDQRDSPSPIIDKLPGFGLRQIKKNWDSNRGGKIGAVVGGLGLGAGGGVLGTSLGCTTIGAGIGSLILPGFGTIVGGVTGGVVGFTVSGLCGAILGSELGKQLDPKRSFVNRESIERGIEKIMGNYPQVVDTTRHIVSTTKSLVEDVFEKLQNEDAKFDVTPRALKKMFFELGWWFDDLEIIEIIKLQKWKRQITFDQFYEYYENNPKFQQTPKKIEISIRACVTFEKYDPELTGCLSRDLFVLFYNDFVNGIIGNPTPVDDVIMYIDPDETGKIYFNEFIKWEMRFYQKKK
jgi:Ca2+-binding EF-hand superfamily protein